MQSFSSYPAYVSSNDDFYITEQVETISVVIIIYCCLLFVIIIIVIIIIIIIIIVSFLK
jgi:hypothetical protein